jgi:triosephosphate isomerase
MKKPLIIAGNWKMHKTIAEAVAFVKMVLPEVAKSQARVLVAPPFTALYAASEAAKGSQLMVGAQNMCEAEKGAFTGEISAKMIQEAGGKFVILGHSERRHVFHESDALIRKKLERALADQLQPILCVGETGDERKAGKSEEVVGRQLGAALKGLTESELEKLIIAYEPVWAIGTGLAATPELAEEIHAWIAQYLEIHWSRKLADKVPLLYGGSVKPDNIEALVQKPHIDGALIGGAALDAQAFIQMIHAGETP